MAKTSTRLMIDLLEDEEYTVTLGQDSGEYVATVEIGNNITIAVREHTLSDLDETLRKLCGAFV